MELRTASELEKSAAVTAEPTARYDGTSILLHWLTAGLVVLLWGIAQVIDLFPKGPPRIAARSTHILLGVVLGIVLLVRVLWRSSSGRRLPRATPGLFGAAATLIHYGLYIVVAATVALGLFNAWVRGDHFFELFALPKFDPNNPGLKSTVEDLHGTFANTVLIVAGLHAAAALVHHFVLRDRVLRRMWPDKESR
jgi:cytochrome b561